MLGKSLKEQLIELRSSYEIQQVNFFNDGSITKDDGRYTLRKYDDIDIIGEQLKKAAESYSRFGYSYDRIDMNVRVGLIYNSTDVGENNAIKEGTKPINGKVRIYTESINSYLDNEKTNVADYNDYGFGRQGWVDYNRFIDYVYSQGLTLQGPHSFEEFKDKILSGETFNIVVSANLGKTLKMKKEN